MELLVALGALGAAAPVFRARAGRRVRALELLRGLLHVDVLVVPVAVLVSRALERDRRRRGGQAELLPLAVLDGARTGPVHPARLAQLAHVLLGDVVTVEVHAVDVLPNSA